MLQPKKKPQQSFENKIYQSCPVTRMIYWTLMGILLIIQIKNTDAAKYKDDSCVTKSKPGICKEWSECPIMKTLIERGEYTTSEVVNCGFVIREELICCPVIRNDASTNIFVIPNSSTISPSDRPAVRACRRIEAGLKVIPVIHVVGGTPVHLGEFPHMAALGYSRIGGDNRPPYDIRCGGTLIDKRYVLTAAHCASDIQSVPSIVRLGVVNFTDINQMKEAVEIKIKKIFLHNEYRISKTYNDIAVLELESEVETSEYIYPACLHTNIIDPDSNLKLWVSGWGTLNTTARSFSNILLKAPLHTSPLERCNESIVEYGLDRKISEGVKTSQLCAEDKDQKKDACEGDSGGPLHLIINETYKNFRLVGVVTSGFGCASSTPGLYTRVAAFLDFIENIVWPNGGD